MEGEWERATSSTNSSPTVLNICHSISAFQNYTKMTGFRLTGKKYLAKSTRRNYTYTPLSLRDRTKAKGRTGILSGTLPRRLRIGLRNRGRCKPPLLARVL